MGLCKDKKMNLPEAGGKNTKMNLPEAGGMSSTAPGCFLLHSLLHQQVFAFSGPKKSATKSLFHIYNFQGHLYKMYKKHIFVDGMAF